MKEKEQRGSRSSEGTRPGEGGRDHRGRSHDMAKREREMETNSWRIERGRSGRGVRSGKGKGGGG